MERNTRNELTDSYSPTDPAHQRKSVNLLPGYLQTDKNAKFLSSTLDRLIEVPKVERIDGFVGSKITPTFQPGADLYIGSVSPVTRNYQLEPSLIIRDSQKNISRALGYDDLINQIAFHNGAISNHNKIFDQKTYSFNPQIDLDKFVNYNQYYWLEAGPDPIEITGPQRNTVSTYTVSDDSTELNWVFSPDGLTPDPLLTLYRGMTYVFEVDSVHSFYVKTTISYGKDDQYTKVVNNGTKSGQVIVTVDESTPNTLYYVAGDDTRVVGKIVIKKLIENAVLDVEADILGKKTFRSGNAIEFTNGLMVTFADNVTPESYRNKRFVVEGVGSKITLVAFDSLLNAIAKQNLLDVNFDAEPFDQFPFDDFANAPITPEYITINRASRDLNPWTRYNRWVHKGVIEASAAANGVQPVFPQDKRASRPIIEFNANIKLYNFGHLPRLNIDLIDNFTVSAFKSVENSAGYHIDGILLEEGARVIFNADTDPLVRGKVYEVHFNTINGNQRVNLREAPDATPTVGDSITSIRGTKSAGANWWWDGNVWQYAQQKTTLNQAPIFDVFDQHGISFSDTTYYQGSFAGTKIFGYEHGTGTADSVLGFPLKYLNVSNIGDYLFANYFNTDTFVVTQTAGNSVYSVSSGFLKIYDGSVETYKNVWETSQPVAIPILQYEVITTPTNNVFVTAVNNPATLTDLSIDIWVNDDKQTLGVDFTFDTQGTDYIAVFTKTLSVDTHVLFKIHTSASPNSNGYYEPSLGLTNNPLNGPIEQVTLAEVTDHYRSIAERVPTFSGSVLGFNNFRDLGDTGSYGTRLISHLNPLSFAHFFVGQQEHDAISAIRKVGKDYENFKRSFLRKLNQLSAEISAVDAVDQLLGELNAGKDIKFPYGYSDMVSYGNDYILRKYPVTDIRITTYSLTSSFDPAAISERSVLVYHNGSQLNHEQDYVFNAYDPTITFLIPLAVGDILEIRDYASTEGCYVPPTPTKLGLYPKFTPSIYLDNTYVTPVNVMQGHDGSITLAFNDYRDAILLELEKRIYNNLKVTYNADLLDINAVMPSAYRTTDYEYSQVFEVLSADFLSWAGSNGVDYISNSTVDVGNPFTFNYSVSTKNTRTSLPFPGYWRGIYKYFYDTDRPHTNPWEMLGFSEQPSWWTGIYGKAPYTSGNLILWQDLADGRIAGGSRKGIDPKYIRSNLLSILPVNDQGNLVDPITSSLAQNLLQQYVDAKWKFGDHGPAETAWRRSSNWPFAVQILMALTKTSSYASLMFDTSRIKKSIAGQYLYGTNEQLLSLSSLTLYRDTVNGVRQLASGYGVMLIEAGLQHSSNYLDSLKADLAGINYNLMFKAEGFISKDKLQIIIDSVDPTSTNPGVLLPQEDYSIFLDKSNPIASINISGLIIQKVGGLFVVRGYDSYHPYFTVLQPIKSTNDIAIRVGGVEDNYVTWTDNSFYQTGQVVFYTNKYYRTTASHTSTGVFDTTKFQQLPSLPGTGGASVSRASKFSTVPTIVPYGTSFYSIQEVFDLMIGYGAWLESQGFVFDYIQPDFNQILNWEFSGKEFLFWTTQNWSDGSLITISPFAQQIKFSTTSNSGPAIYGVIDDITNQFYEYSLITADGSAFSVTGFSLSREDGEFTIVSNLPNSGFFFAQVNLVQKQHAVVFNNYSMFNDIIYDIETGYRQRRAKLSGFRTAEWDGGFTSPGFVYDNGIVVDWTEYTDYNPGEVVRYAGNYYGAIARIPGSSSFDFNHWNRLPEKPVAQLLPNFDYKINQFEDFYSLDVDNFDVAQQRMAQHLTGYVPRAYLDNIFHNPIAQYKFYQGYIREKGTANAVNKIAKASLNNLKGEATFSETWAFRIGQFGGFNTYQELEVNLDDSKFTQNPQIIKFTDYPVLANDFVYYKSLDDILIKPDNYIPANSFPTIDVNYKDYVSELPTAGYVRIDDVDATAYNTNSILDIGDTNQVKEGATFWIGFTSNGGWDVVRYTRTKIRIIQSELPVAGGTVVFTTNIDHGLTVGDLVSISRYIPALNRVYVVTEVSDTTHFTVGTTLTSIPYTAEVYLGIVAKFVSVRFNSFDDLYALPRLTTTLYGDKIWVDNDGTGKFAVYEKIDNYAANVVTNLIENEGQFFGFNSSFDSSTSTYAVSAPFYNDINYGKGLVFVYDKTSISGVAASPVLSFALNETGASFYSQSTPVPEFGHAVIYDKFNDAVFTSAPGTSHVRANGIHVASTNTAQLLNSTGVVKITGIYRNSGIPVTVGVITTPSPVTGSRFGQSMIINHDSANKKLLVGAPGENKVYNFTVAFGSTNTSTATISLAGQSILPNAPTQPDANFGYSVAGNKDLSVIAVGAPGYFYNQNISFGPTDLNTGIVYVYTATNVGYVLAQTIDRNVTDSTGKLGLKGIINASDELGSKIVISADGEYMFISSPGTQYGVYQGLVSVWKWNGVTFDWLQNIINPNQRSSVVFGYDISIDEGKQTLTISSLGDVDAHDITFDQYSELLAGAATRFGTKYVTVKTDTPKLIKTTFDNGSTRWTDTIKNAGIVSVFNRTDYSTYFSYAQDLNFSNLSTNSNFGFNVNQWNGTLYVSAPTSGTDLGNNNGELVGFTKKDPTLNSWSLHRRQDALVDVSLIKKVLTVDNDMNKISNYLEIIDPVKGKIAGVAAQELSFRAGFDPAVYSVGTTAVTVNGNTNWIDEHVGELWWDTSAVKYFWYEQGDVEYRKNHWGNTFPGSAIQVYEWVKTKFLPSEWAAIADTESGLASGISGQPKHADKSVLSVKQVYNKISGTFSNVYYYWVRNKATIPAGNSTRKLSSLSVAGLIADPLTQELMYANFLSSNSISLVNVKNTIKSNTLNLHISMDTIRNAAPRHTEWTLLQEGDATSTPTVLLERKLIDSLVGFDSVGNAVPDPSLSAMMKYGTSVRPRQSMFANRFEALRNLLTWTNDILAVNRIRAYCNFENLNAAEAIPDIDLNEYDALVEDNYTLGQVITKGLAQATLSCLTNTDGQITRVRIRTSGNSYNLAHPPTVEVVGDGEGAVIKTILNERGQVVDTLIVSAGSGYTSPPELIVRPYTVIVRTDSEANGFWSKFQWSQLNQSWVSVHTQKYDTTLYWNYIDWQDPTYNKLVNVVTAVDSPYELSAVTANAGDYVKVKNAGNGFYAILRKTPSSTIGTWNADWDIVYEEQGTIQLSSTLWDPLATNFAFDEVAAFDQTLFDQAPDNETVYVLEAIRKDIFTGPLQVCWNQFWFKAVKYALSEQKSLDWAFKTSYIDVVNHAGSLDQRPTYKLQDSTFYEQWIEEVKPYHTQIKNFTVNYTATEYTNSFTTDFDLPAVYSSTSSEFTALQLGDARLLSYPQRSWYDNYTYGVDSIDVVRGGSNYITAPAVKIISAIGDNGTGATAVAYISLGVVSDIIVTNAGTGYTQTPTILLEGGGGVDYVQSTAVARLSNNKVRSTKVTLKFDRYSYTGDVATTSANDQYTCDGEKYTFKLTWAPQKDRSTIKVKSNGSMILNDKYTIVYNNGGATLELNYVPVKNAIITISYQKDFDYLNAIDRINTFYEPLPGMPGIDPDQLMSGLSYGGVKIDTLPFSYAAGWDMLPFQQGAWDSYSAETNYGVVKDPQIGFLSTEIPPLTAALAAQDLLIAAKVAEITEMGRILANTPPYLFQGSQYVPNPVYIQREQDFFTATGELHDLETARAQIQSQIDGILNSRIPVTIPFTVTTPSRINAYITTVTNNISQTSRINFYDDATASVAQILQVAEVSTNTISMAVGTPAVVRIPQSYFSTLTSAIITFRDETSDGTILPSDPDALDVVVDGGAMDNIFIGIAPSDVVLDGSGFLDSYASHAPEEMLPGQIQESFAVSVFEQKPSASPLIISRRYQLDPLRTLYDIGGKIASTASVLVTLSTGTLRYAKDYTVNTVANQINLTSPQSNGWINITGMTVGGQGLLDNKVVVDRNTTSTTITSVATLSNIKDAYVTINGQETKDWILIPAPGYAGKKRPKGAITVYHNAIGSKEIQVWFFNHTPKAYSQVHEQIFTNIDPQASTFTLDQPPGKVEPLHGQVIVEFNGVRLLPPEVTYYTVSNGQTQFDPTANDPYVSGQVDLSTLEVYRNGVKLTSGMDYQLSSVPVKVSFGTGFLADGDALAIVALRGHQYLMVGNNLQLVNVTRTASDTMRVITFTNHDGSGIRKERYAANLAGKYPMSRPIKNTDYVWVEYNGKALINDIDYRVDSDLITVYVDSSFYTASTDKVVIMSLSDDAYEGATGYRMFTDLLGRTSFKRLSAESSTTLAQPLVASDTMIYVKNAAALTAPNRDKNLPGIIYIAGERIEFFQVDYTANTLSQLRRGTLGTGILDGLPASTLVIDQGRGQNMPVTEATQMVKITASNTSTYSFSGITFNTDADPQDQIAVYYGGRQLAKVTTSTTDISIAPEPGQSNSFGVSNVTTAPAEFSVSTVTSVTATLTLNIPVQAGVEILVTQRTGLIFEKTPVFTFLTASPTLLPDDSYYPGDPVIILETGEILTNEDSAPLEGI